MSRQIKFVENPDLDSISTYLTDRLMGCVMLNGKIEVFQIETTPSKSQIKEEAGGKDARPAKPHVKISLHPRSRSDNTEDHSLLGNDVAKQKKSSSSLLSSTTTPATSLGTSPSTSQTLPPRPQLASSVSASFPVFRQVSDPQEWASTNRRPRSNSAGLPGDLTSNSSSGGTKMIVTNGKSKVIVGSTATQQLQQPHPSRHMRKRSSSLSDLNENSSKLILADIIAVLNESFPDYDFSNIRSKQIVEKDVVTALQVVNAYLSELEHLPNGGNMNLLERLWKHADDAINLRRCDVYSYMTDNEGDPFSSGAIWSFNYFFINREIKRICFFHCIASSTYGHRLTASMPSTDDILDLTQETEESDNLHSEDEEEDETAFRNKRIALSFLDGDDASEDEFTEAY